MGALVRDGRVLLVRRGLHKRAFPGAWDLPGGVVEPGESPAEGLLRELDEELAVEVAADAISPLCEVRVAPAGDPVMLRAWLVHAWHGEPVNAAPDEHDDLDWCAIDDLPPLAHASVRAALVAALR